jgi:hypothetical protein
VERRVWHILDDVVVGHLLTDTTGVLDLTRLLVGVPVNGVHRVPGTALRVRDSEISARLKRQP